MLKKDLAVALGISAAMVTKLAARGMPTDSTEAATAWRRNNLSPFRTKQRRIDGNTGLRRGKRPALPLSPAELLKLATDIVGLLADCEGEDFALGCEHLRGVILALPEDMQLQVRLPVAIWNHLVGELEP